MISFELLMSLISHSLGTDFIPYLKYVVPPLIRIAENQDSLSITDASIVEGQAPEGWDILDVGDKVRTVRLTEMRVMS